MPTPLDAFMIKEYEQIAEAFFALHTQKNQILRYYLAVMTLGATGIGVASQIVSRLPSVTISTISSLIAAGGLLFVLAFIGIIAFNSIIGIRADMILYARTVNRVRAYFLKRDMNIQEFLVLPCTDREPRFREGVLNYFFSEVVLLSFLNSLVLAFSIWLIFEPRDLEMFLTEGTIGLLTRPVGWTLILTALHVAYYFGTSKWREDRYRREHGYLELKAGIKQT